MIGVFGGERVRSAPAVRDVSYSGSGEQKIAVAGRESWSGSRDCRLGRT